MNKMLIALAAASFALALTPAAQAGFTVPSISGKSLIVKACDDDEVVGYVAEPEDDEVYMPPQASLPQQSVASLFRARAACCRNAQEDGRCFRQDGYQGGHEVGHENGNEVGDKEGRRQEVGVKERRFRRCGKLQEILLLGRHDPVGPLRVRDRRV